MTNSNTNEETPNYPRSNGPEFVFLGKHGAYDLYYIQEHVEMPIIHVRYGPLEGEYYTNTSGEWYEKAVKLAEKRGIKVKMTNSNTNEETPNHPRTDGPEFVFLGRHETFDLYYIQDPVGVPRIHLRYGPLNGDYHMYTSGEWYEKAEKLAEKRGIKIGGEDTEDKKIVYPLPHVSTGSWALNNLIGGARAPLGISYCPGFPQRSFTQLYGDVGSGHREVALQAVGECLQKSERVVWVCFPGSKFDKSLANRFECSVFHTHLKVLQLESLQEFLEGIRELGRNDPPKLLVFDFLGAEKCDTREMHDFILVAKEVICTLEGATLGLFDNTKINSAEMGWLYFAAISLSFERRHHKFGEHIHVTAVKNKRAQNGVGVLDYAQGAHGGIDDVVTLLDMHPKSKWGFNYRNYLDFDDPEVVDIESYGDAVDFLRNNKKAFDALCQCVSNACVTSSEKESSEEKTADIENLLDF